MKTTTIKFFFVISIFVYFVPLDSIAEQSMNYVIYYSGLYKGKSTESSSPGEKNIYEKGFEEINSKEAKQKVENYFNTFHQTPLGKEYASKAIHFFSGEWAEAKDRIPLVGRKDEKKLNLEQCGLAFFTLDDILYLTETTASGFTKISLYYLVSFYIFDLNDRVIFYNAEYVVPFSSGTRNEQVMSFVEGMFKDEKFKQIMPYFIKNLCKSITKRKSLSKVIQLKLNHRNPEYALAEVDTGMSLNYGASLKQKHKSQFKGNHKNDFINLANYIATIRIGKNLPVLPTLVLAESSGDDNVNKRYSHRYEKLKHVITKAYEGFIEYATGKNVILTKDETKHTNRPQQIVLNTEKIFPIPSYLFAFSIQTSQKRLSFDGIKYNDEFCSQTILMNVKQQWDKSWPTIYDIEKDKNKTYIDFNCCYNEDYIDGDQLSLSDAYYFNCLIKSFFDKQKKSLDFKNFIDEFSLGSMKQAEEEFF